MISIRKTSNVVSIGRTSSKSGASSADQNTQITSPFAARPAESLKGITERKSRLNEEQKLAILQNALLPFANEARSHLPPDLSMLEKKVREQMTKEGLPKEFVAEAGDEAVSVSLKNRRVSRKPDTKKG
jgi:hypothetical protein